MSKNKEIIREKETSFRSATGITPIYGIHYKGKTFALFKTYVGAPACAATIEDTLSELQTDKYIVFGGAGCLNKEIAHGKAMIPTEAYRDEGTSYHYAPASDYITVKNADTVAALSNCSCSVRKNFSDNFAAILSTFETRSAKTDSYP